ncbi:AAA family ATPase [Endozoicomonas sp. SCSIO W0465]|uniref:AAA family ATPase n=1 Tax=Endozoicomonas sp. SCSIO W0465 TaxID=2918516 RepID=UPI002074DA2C|nr:AAA family ATPase [Endozoicomonas sp. SCSIO W0465]USE34574.1 AAA family ATPase [Endozoicomonas sp. SCSIO W0465]
MAIGAEIVKVDLPSSQVPVSGKKRTVCSTGSLQSKPTRSFDFRFVTNDNQVRSLLSARTHDENRDVVIISHPDDLLQANLVSRLSISGDGCHSLQPGKLFVADRPLTLVIDIRTLTSEELPRFNDLLDPDNPCLYDRVSQKKRPLGGHIALLVVADPEQLAAVGKSDEAPGADFWRRINRPGNTWQFDSLAGNGQSMESGDVPLVDVPPVLAEFPDAMGASDDASDDDSIVVIDCHLHGSWRQLLFGGPGVDQQGRIQHIPGKLEQLQAGQRVILKGANWQDLAFEQTMRQLLAHKHYESNGILCHLPDDVQFYQMPLGDDELYSLFRTVTQGEEKREKGLFRNPPGNPLIINQGNITEWLNPIAIAREGYAVPNTRLLERIQAGDVVTVTSPLSEALWFRLLGALQTIRQTTGVEPCLQVACTRQQPKALRLVEENEEQLLPINLHQADKCGDHTLFSAVTYQQQAQATHWINSQQQAPLVIQVHEQTSFSQLFDNIHMTSEKNGYFGRRQSGLQAALTAGRPVVFRGLESSPRLQQLLEPMMCGQPLLVHGQLQAYPQARVTLLWPEGAQSPSPVWRSMIAAGEPCPELDIWDITAVNHGIPRAELPEQVLDQLCAAFATVPANLCNPLPAITQGLLNNLVLAARRAQQVDRAPQLQPCHWRKAIDSVFTHGTRQNRSVRDFMKVACWQLLPDAEDTAWVDLHGFNTVINSARRLDRDFVEQNVWQLARAFGPAAFADTELKQLNLYYPRPFNLGIFVEFLDMICALKLDPQEPEQDESLSFRPCRQIKRLEDALASGWQLRPSSFRTRRDAIHALAADCFDISTGTWETANHETECIGRIAQRLSQSLDWKGSADPPWSLLARDLYYGSMNQKDREHRRLSRLHDRLVDSPVIFLQGETGAGKSYFAARMAGASGGASVMSLGPSDSEQTLMKRWQWQEQADGDRCMAQQHRALMEWAHTQPDKDGRYVTLVLDEANLANAGLLASLNGLWEPEPCIYVNGHPVRVSTRHRVILTGNPDHYAGRQLDPALKEKLPGAYYPPLDMAFLRDRVVEPALLRQLQRHLPEQQAGDIAHRATDSVMALWQYYPECLPEHAFTPRDLTDICSWVGWYLDRGLPGMYGPVTPEQMNGLVLQSFRDVLGAEVMDENQAFRTALELWFSARYPVDSTLSDRVHNQTLVDIQRAFMQVTAQTRPEFDTSGSAVSELVRRLGQDVSRCQQAHHLGRPHGGRQATLIEGPAGRGKDVTLNLLLDSVKQQAEQRGESMPEIFTLNACDCSWDQLCAAIAHAKVNGGIVVISEMNLIDSQHLEGELNDILAGDAHPGFHLFATTNPPEYSGRKPLSPALKGRFRHVPIRQYNPAELQTIVAKVLPQTPQGKSVAEQLTHWHCRLRCCLQRQKRPLQPTSLDLQNVARAVINGGDFTGHGVRQCIHHHYQLYLMAAKTSLDELPELPATSMGKSVVDHTLCDWLNRTVSAIDRPWLIRRNDVNCLNEKRHVIDVKAHLSQAEARTEMIRMVAQARWQASGLPLMPDSSDVLIQGLYRHWQRHWFNQEFGQTGVDANTVFALTNQQEQTLKMQANQPHLKEADKQLSTWDSSDVFLWPAFWSKLSRIFYAAPYDRSKSTVYKLDFDTDYQQQEKPRKECRKYFNDDTAPCMYRLRVDDMDVDSQGNILFRVLEHGEYGLETVFPSILPEGELVLDEGQCLGRIDHLDVHENKYYLLPGLNPDETIPALRITPSMDFQLSKDRYTGLHAVYFSDTIDHQQISIDFVVEKRSVKSSVEALDLFQQAGDARPDGTVSGPMKLQLTRFFDGFEASTMPENQKEQIRLIQRAETLDDRITAIARYCSDFKGIEKYKHNGDDGGFFHFLLWRRQGRCVHIAPIFVALCRYFGIPARMVSNQVHTYSEYSQDGGISWQSKDLGGAPVHQTLIKPVFQPCKRGSYSSTESGKIKDFLKDATLEQHQSRAKAYNLSLELLHEIVDAGYTTDMFLDTQWVVLHLWRKKNLAGLSASVAILEAKATLSREDKALIGDVGGDGGNTYKPLSDAVRTILFNSDEDQVTQHLRALHSKMVVHGGASSLDWLGSIVDILSGSNLARPSVIHFAHEALESGWLDPQPTGDSPTTSMHLHLLLVLVCLEGVDGLKTKAGCCLKNWYQELFSIEKNSQIWQRAYKNYQQNQSDPFVVTHCCGGISPFLETKIASTSLQSIWTNEPEGVPDIERLLVHDPAFSRFSSGKANQRPVLIVGHPFWYRTDVREKAKALLQQKIENNSALKELAEKQNKCDEMVEQRNGELRALQKRYDQKGSKAYRKCYEKMLEQCNGELIALENLYDQKASKAKYQSVFEEQSSTSQLERVDQTAFEKYEYEKERQDIISRYQPVLDSLIVPISETAIFRELDDKYQQAIQQAFSHYLYGMTHSNGGRLTYCWGDARFRFAVNDKENNYGAHSPSSPEELYAMMAQIKSDVFFQNSVNDTYLRQVHNASNALVLKSDELTKIAEEFVNSVDLSSIYDSLDT